MTPQPLPVSMPAAEGVGASGIEAFLDAVEAAPDIELHSLMILRHGRVIASGWWSPYQPDQVHLLYSLSKSFTATAAGLAAAEGLLSLDEPVVSYFPEFAADIRDPGSRSILVRHIAAMASGHLTDTWDEARRRDPDEPVRGFLLVVPDREPGTVFAYNQSATYTLAAIVQKLTGQTLTQYLRPRLLDPLGIEQASWLSDRRGREVGFSGLHTTTDAIARLGQLYLAGGSWAGRQLLPAWWTADATRAQIPNAAGNQLPDWQQGYGFQFWMSRHGFRGDGAYGQFCLVLPEQDAVIAITADTGQMQAVLDAVWDLLLPAFSPAAARATPGRQQAADEQLRLRLANLELPPSPGTSHPPAPASVAPGTQLSPLGGRCAGQPSLTGVTITSAGADSAGGWIIRLAEGDSSLDLRCVPGRWTVSPPAARIPVAVSGGWSGAGTLVFDVAFVQTPHHLIVTCTPQDGTFQARWRTVPLHGGPLRRFRAPRR